mgnify:CR=1 FL=1
MFGGTGDTVLSQHYKQNKHFAILNFLLKMNLVPNVQAEIL